MDYHTLATELMTKMFIFHKGKKEKDIHDGLRGSIFVLDYISRNDEAVLPGHLSEVFGISTARIAAILNGLEEKGLICREIDKDDRRRILIRLTDNGRRAATQHNEYFLAKTVAMLEALGEHDAKEYVRIMGRLSELMPKLDF